MAVPYVQRRYPDPNFATQTDDDYIAKVASGRVVAITDAEWHYSQCEATLVADGKVDQTYVGLPVTLREDQVEKPFCIRNYRWLGYWNYQEL